MGYSVKEIRKQFKSKGVFYTDEKLSRYIKSFIGDDVREVYDPTCGNGSLLSVFADDVKKFGQEINPEQLEVAKEMLVNFTGYAGDTLKAPAFMERKFDAIVANPPFSIKWSSPSEADERFKNAPTIPTESKADYAFILHILYMLSEHGTAAVLNFPGVLYRGGREGEIRKWIIQNNWIEKVVHIEGGYFEDTAISTALIVFRKNKSTTNIEFIDHERNLSRLVPISEIEDNGYSLSVSSYISFEEEKEEVDPLELKNNIHKHIFNNLKSALDIELFISDLENYSVIPLLTNIERLIKSYKNRILISRKRAGINQTSLFND